MDSNLGFIIVMIPVVLFMFFLPIALLVALQAWLCRKSLKLGLILPCISLGLSLLMVFSMGAFTTMHGGVIGGGASYVGPNGQEVPVQADIQEQREIEFHPRTLLAIGGVFLVANIPTAVFGGIWLHCKGRRDTVEDLKRMQIEDLG